MRVVHLSTTDGDGGAARAAARIHRGLLQAGVDSRLVVARTTGSEAAATAARGLAPRVVARFPRLDRLALLAYPRRARRPWSVGWLPTGVERTVAALAPDVVNLHWVGDGFLSVAALGRLPQPLVWTLHDMAPFTGGCHYDEECGRYRAACGACPQLRSHRERDRSRATWQRKRDAWAALELTVVSPSRWLADCARASSLFGGRRVATVPYGLDLARYRPLAPVERDATRAAHQLPGDAKLLLFGALQSTADPRKGFDLLAPLAARLAALGWGERAVLAVLGPTPPTGAPPFALPTRFLGTIRDEAALAAIYAAADVFVAPSRQDNLPNTVVEALACATPSVAFAVGGMPDLVEHRETGWLATPFALDELAAGVDWVLADDLRHAALRRAARAKAERELGLPRCAERYQELYRELLATAG